MDPIDEDSLERLRVFLERAWPLLIGRPLATPGEPQCAPIVGDGSVRRLFRAQRAGVSAIAVLNPLASGRAHPDENEAFLAVREFLALRGVRVPAVYAADLEHGLLLLEDLGDARLLEACRSGLDPALYEQALRILVAMQAPGEPAFRPEVTGNPAYDENFILAQEAGYFLEEVVQGWCGLPWPRQSVEADCRRLARQALGGPRVFMHRDFQSRNLMALGSSLAVIDFQGARLGPAEYDLAALLYDPYVEMPPEARDGLALRYLELARGAGLDGVPAPAGAADAQAAWRARFLANAANRLMQASAAFVKLGVRFGRPGFREHIPRGLARLQSVLAEKGDAPALAALVAQVSAQVVARAVAQADGASPLPARRIPGLSAVVLSGGRSRRFGGEKGLALFRGTPLIERALACLDRISDDVWISTQRPDLYEHLARPMVADVRPGCGPLGGIHAALRLARNPLLAVVSCDMPFASADLFRFLHDRASDADVVVPSRAASPAPAETAPGGPATTPCEPLHAVYGRACLPAIEAALERGERRVVSFFPQVRVAWVPEAQWRQAAPGGDQVFANINTRDELETLERSALD